MEKRWYASLLAHAHVNTRFYPHPPTPRLAYPPTHAVELARSSRRKWDVQPNQRTYCVAIKACERPRQWETALELLQEMSRNGVEPNVRVYTAAMKVCCASEEGERALVLLDEMRRKGVLPDVFSYSVGISAFTRGGHWERALGVLRQMQG